MQLQLLNSKVQIHFLLLDENSHALGKQNQLAISLSYLLSLKVEPTPQMIAGQHIDIRDTF